MPARHARFWLLLATLFWGLSFPFGKAASIALAELMPGADRWLVTSLPLLWRFALAALLLAAVFGLRVLPRRRSEVFHGMVLGIACGGGLILQMTGLQSVDASVSAFLTQLGVAIVPFLVALDKRVWPSRVVWLALLLVLLGGAILVELDPRAIHLAEGEMLTLAGALCFSVQVYWLERDDFRTQALFPCTWVMFLTIAFIFGLVALILAPQTSQLWEPLAGRAVWMPIAGLTLLCTFGAFTLMNHFQKRVSATEAGVIYGMESVFASLLALQIPGLLAWASGITYANEQFGWNLALGGSCILAATVLIVRAPPAGKAEGSVGTGGTTGTDGRPC